MDRPTNTSKNSNSSLITKADFRQHFKQRLTNVDETGLRQKATEGLVDRIRDFLARYPGSVWAAYQPAGFEPDIRRVFEFVHQITWVFPRVIGEHIGFLRPNSRTSFSMNKWGILEPDPRHSEVVELRDLRGLLIPALAFDLHCNRLGRGGGYYDRALAELKSVNPTAIKIGVGLDLQISNDPFPTESFDIPMDWVVTDTRCLERKTS